MTKDVTIPILRFGCNWHPYVPSVSGAYQTVRRRVDKKVIVRVDGIWVFVARGAVEVRETITVATRR